MSARIVSNYYGSDASADDANTRAADTLYARPSSLTDLYNMANTSNRNDIPLGVPFADLMRRVHWYLFTDCSYKFLIYGSVVRDRQFGGNGIVGHESIPKALYNTTQISDIDIRTSQPMGIVHELRHFINAYCNGGENIQYLMDTLNAIHVTTTRIRIYNQVIIDVTFMEDSTMERLLKHSERIDDCETQAYVGPAVQTIHDVFRHISRPRVPVLGNPMLPQCETAKWRKSMQLVDRIIKHIRQNPADSDFTADIRPIGDLNRQRIVLRPSVVYSGLVSAAIVVWYLRDQLGAAVPDVLVDEVGDITVCDGQHLMWTAPRVSSLAIVSGFGFRAEDFSDTMPYIFVKNRRQRWYNLCHHIIRIRELVWFLNTLIVIRGGVSTSKHITATKVIAHSIHDSMVANIESAVHIERINWQTHEHERIGISTARRSELN